MENGKQPAFAHCMVDSNSGAHLIEPGLTKREYFAGLAMQGIVDSYMNSTVPIDEVVEQPRLAAEWSVKFADALLKALES